MCLGLAIGGIAIFQLGNRLIVPNRFEVGLPPNDLPIETVKFASSGGISLSGWLIKHPIAKAGILLMHGSGQNRAIMIPRARFLYEAGYSVFLFDFRAHGQSEGRYRTFGIGEHDDATAALQVLKEKTGVNQTAIIGFSLGGAAAILGPSPLDTDAFVLEAVFPKIETAIANRIKLRLGPLFPWTQSLLSLQIPIRTGIPLLALQPIDQIGKIAQPIFLIAGAEDQRTTAEESKALYNAIQATTKKLWIVANANHTNYHAAAPDLYEKKVTAFLRGALASSSDN